MIIILKFKNVKDFSEVYQNCSHIIYFPYMALNRSQRNGFQNNISLVKNEHFTAPANQEIF